MEPLNTSALGIFYLGVGGAHLALYPISNTPVHFYFEYDSLVSSRIVYTENNIVTPFRKNDTLSGVERDLPDTSFSELKTDEFVFQVGSAFK